MARACGREPVMVQSSILSRKPLLIPEIPLPQN